MEWIVAMETVVALLLLVFLLPIAGLYGRRRWLSSRGGVFDCALKLRSGNWATGVARYEGNELQWFRIFSLRMSPTVTLTRDDTSSIGRRSPDPDEAVVLFSDDEIMQVRSTDGGRAQTWELAMHPASVTGLMSWLEAAPPRGDSYGVHELG
ncbi:DUF2550 domain-containing protein [Luteococcus sp. Sow4_B9]|uniref:DUF2550 domain-containing protein n=1 Tax=Luteococcus sp. Sow4_B9 TaxID=3438792 RepID=UPI003F9BBC89